ncbi:amidohydrolase [Chromatocurvus halotolerans]|uniref:Amidohydrolase 3 domain-containing protein n=1 Tax=Chromatocurvus halotolerans TaxID=1132028 RepID=A0A4R2LEI9_9GAMM|nr:amidohydrolase [Chromatocurvus halotolerans]TCO77715.1 hypothetical protein EV688_102172 [Chromatocurvus halotolerans]
MNLAKTARLLIIVTLLASLGFFATRAAATDTVYYNGTIITMDDDRPLAEAVAVREGRIVAVGNRDIVMASAGKTARRIDLGGHTLLPGFVDSHGHAYAIGLQASTANLLPPPDGAAADIPALQAQLADWMADDPAVMRGIGWVIGFGYDDSQLAEQRHPTRRDLDAVTIDYPVMIIHQSGHFGVANSKALERLGITTASENPDGGIIRREQTSRQPNGVLEEMAFLAPLMQLLSQFDDAMNEHLVIEGTRLAATYGYTTVQEGRAMPAAIAAMRRVAERGALDVDLVAYPDMLAVPDVTPSRTYAKRFRIGGVKLTIDGSPQGKTAYLSEPYFHPPHGQSADYRGYGAIDESTARASVARAFARGWQILCHANGDAAIDQYIDAVRAAQTEYPDVDNRPVLIHGQTLRKDQVEAIDELGIFPSLFPMHTFYWGDWHRDSVLGPVRADNISPTGWLLPRGMMFGSHHDAPVALPDAMRVLSATVTRRSRSGDILGPEHRVPVATALKAMTLWPAWQHFEENEKGSIEPGKLADFVVLSANPMAVPEEQLNTLMVEQTIKEGRIVYQR